MAIDPAVHVAVAALVGGSKASSLESEVLDFKQEGDSQREAERLIADAAICFANGQGGIIVVGVDDKAAGPEAFVGTTLEPSHVKRRVFDLTRPSLLVDVERIDAGGVTLLQVRVPESPDVHSDTKGRTARRVGTDCLPMDASEISRLRDDRQGVDASAKPSAFSASAVDAAAVELARRHLRRFPDDRAALADLSDERLLGALGAIDGQGRLTRAGEILLATEPNEQPRVVYQFRDTPGGEPRAIERLSRAALIAYDRALELISARRVTTTVPLENGQQLEIADFPTQAVEEALANAILHRDYHLAAAVLIDHSPQALSITSPGPLVAGVTPQNILTHPSKPRNARLITAARTLRLAEEVGQGVDRMYRAMIASGRDVPAIDSDHERVTVTFLSGTPNRRIAAFVAERLPETERGDVETMLVLVQLCRRRTITAQQAAILFQQSLDPAEATLRRLAGDDVALLEKTRGTARASHPAYRLRDAALRSLGPAVSYNRRTEDEIDRKVIAHVREYGKITNQTVRNLLDVDIQRAGAILVDLVRREILRKAGSGQRGPGVEYQPGERFPSRRRPPRS